MKVGCCLTCNVAFPFLFCRFVLHRCEPQPFLWFGMLTPGKHRLSSLLLSVLLLHGWTADGAGNTSAALGPPSRDVVVKEGSSALIECNVTGDYTDMKWYNPKGRLLGQDEGTQRA